MKSENKKIQAIVYELLSNSLEAQASDISLRITMDDEETVIKITDNGNGMDEETLNYVRRILQQPHRKDMEEYYGNLAGGTGGGSFGSGLNLVGFQIDEAEIESSKEGTQIIVKNKRK